LKPAASAGVVVVVVVVVVLVVVGDHYGRDFTLDDNVARDLIFSTTFLLLLVRIATAYCTCSL